MQEADYIYSRIQKPFILLRIIEDSNKRQKFSLKGNT